MHFRISHTAPFPLVLLLLTFLLPACSGSPPASLGPVAGGLAPCPETPNCVHTGFRESADIPEFTLAPRWTDGATHDLFQRVSQAVTSLPRTEVVDRTDRYLRAEATSRIFRFVDDLEVYLPDEGDRIVVRSSSRLGRSDLGVNLRRVEELHEILRQDGVVTNPPTP